MTPVRLTLLADRPDALAIVARWYFDEWAHKIEGQTIETVRAQLAGHVNRDHPPLLVLALDGDEPVGAAQLKLREMDIYPARSYWLGGVYVAPGHRGRRVGSSLVERVAAITASLNIETLHLQTERMDGGLYARLGWRPVERVCYKGTDVLVMEKPLGNEPAPTS